MVLSEKTENLLEHNRIADLQKPHVAVGIPAFNEEHSIAHIVIEAQKYADTIIVCDDGSTDLTAQIAKRLGADVIVHDGNCGYGAAIKSLFKRALEFGADVLVTLDGDGQHDASEIPQVIRPIIEGNADLVIGSRFIESKGTSEMPFYRKVGAKLITKMVNGSSKDRVSDSQSGFRAYNRQALECLNISEVGMGASVQILMAAKQHNLKITEVSSTCKYENGDISTSTENPVTHGAGLTMSIVKLFIEDKPLMALGLPGIIFLIIGALFGVWMIKIYASAHHIVTNIALVSLGFSLLGFFMISTSITLYAISRLSKTNKQ